jgi:hypothetical protein
MTCRGDDREGRGRRALALALSFALALVSLALIARPAQAQAVRLNVEASRVEVGTPFQVTLTALSEDGEAPSNPRLSVPPGFSVRGPSLSTRTQMSITNGQVTQSQGVDATWVLVSRDVGMFRVGPATVLIGGQRVSSAAVQVQVVAAGQAPRSRRGFDPFGFPDPWAGRGRLPGFGIPGFPGLMDPDEPDSDTANAADAEDVDLSAVPEEIRVASAPDPYAFLRAVVQPKRAVVGEQVRLRVYAYVRAPEVEEGGGTEPRTTDFLQVPLIENSAEEPTHALRIGGAVWRAKKVRDVALFPLRTGTLSVGDMKFVFRDRAGRRYQLNGKLLERSTRPVDVVIVEPPTTGRPAGYRLGDVGDFSLSAEVTPRDLREGDAVSVIVRLEGNGNLPLRLAPPAQNGVTWLEPNVTQETKISDSKVGGWRRFSYLARVAPGAATKKNADGSGSLDLGTFELPFWDPVAKRYRVASADLGALTVRPGPVSAAGALASAQRPLDDADKLLSEFAPRAVLAPAAETASFWADRSAFWALVILLPFAVAGGRASVAGVGRARSWLLARRGSSRLRHREALREARAGLASGSRKDIASACERALVTALDAASGLKTRGVLRAGLRGELTGVGVSEELASSAVSLLDVLDGVRFEGKENPGTAELVDSCERLCRQLERTRPRRGTHAA